MIDDALAQAIAERDAAWRDYASFGGADRLLVYQEKAAAVRALCDHPRFRFEGRGYGAPVCVICGKGWSVVESSD